MKKVIKWILICIIVLVVVFLGVYYFKNNRTLKFTNINKEYTEKVVEREYEEYKNIYITSNAANIYIKNTDEKQIKISGYAEEDQISVDSKENITVDVKSNRKISFAKKNNKVVVFLPSDYNKIVYIDSDYGNINIERYDDLIFDIKADIGSINIASADTITLKSDTAEINIGSVNDLTIQNDIGDIEIGSVAKYLFIDSNVGNIKVNSLFIDKDSYVSCDVGSIKVKNINDVNVKGTASLGSVKINKTNPSSEVLFKASVDVGDIKIG